MIIMMMVVGYVVQVAGRGLRPGQEVGDYLVTDFHRLSTTPRGFIPRVDVMN